MTSKGYLESRAFGHVLTPKGEHLAYTLTYEEEQELMGLLTHDYVVFNHKVSNTRLFRIHMTLRNLGLSSSAHHSSNPSLTPDGIKFTFRCPL